MYIFTYIYAVSCAAAASLRAFNYGLKGSRDVAFFKNIYIYIYIDR